MKTSSFKFRFNKKKTFAIIRILLALTIAFIVCEFKYDYIEALFYDARIRFKPVSEQSGKIELISINLGTVEKLHRLPNAEDYLALSRKLKSAGAETVIFLTAPGSLTGTPIEIKSLANEWASDPRFIVALDDVAMKGKPLQLKEPFEKVSVMGSAKAAEQKSFAADSVIRRMLTSYQGVQLLDPIIAARYNPVVSDDDKIRGVFEYLGSNQVYIDYRPPHTYPTASFVKLLDQGADLSHFKKKIVFIGLDTNESSDDYVKTPFSRDIDAMTVLELHANMLDTMILNSAPMRVPQWLNLILTGLISLVTIYSVLSLRPTRGLLILASTIAGYFVIGFLLFWLAGIWINMAQPFLTIFISYYFFIPYRLIIENRRSWEYFQKNRLLTQVEELKTNFLSMMSHDLKTPIARIQGMTDVVLKDPNPLSGRQQEALETLTKSSQELLDFVSSILNLGRIESKEIELHWKSRDPNSLLSEVIEKLDHLAKSKHIEVVAELEPLFSVKMDVDLIRQVFSNLVENAIKYSRENSRILVTSEESSGRVIIQVADQGVGIEEHDLPHVFQKFYRSKSAKSSTIKGSGLGLYLAKYFVELHSGTISVDSRPGVGSTFTVELPMDSRRESQTDQRQKPMQTGLGN